MLTNMKLRFGAIVLLSAAMTAAAPIPAAQSPRSSPTEGQTIGSKKSENDGHQRRAISLSPLVVEAHVTGKLETTASNAGAETQREHNRWLDPISIFTALLVLVGAFQVWFLRNTDIATTKAANAAQASADAVVSQLRAYVSVRAIEVHDLAAGSTPMVLLELRNTGQTPAFDMEVKAGSIVYPFPLPENTPFPPVGAGGDNPATKMVLHPGGQPFNARAVLGLKQPTGLTQEQAIGLIKGDEVRLYTFAHLTYRDAFGKSRETYFCVSVDASDALTGKVPYKVLFAADAQHNTAT